MDAWRPSRHANARLTYIHVRHTNPHLLTRTWVRVTVTAVSTIIKADMPVLYLLYLVSSRRILYLPRFLSPDALIDSGGSRDGVARVTLVAWVCKFLSQNDRYTPLDEFSCNGRFVKDTYTPEQHL